jgi:hypothetical protein
VSAWPPQLYSTTPDPDPPPRPWHLYRTLWERVHPPHVPPLCAGRPGDFAECADGKGAAALK